MLIGVALDWHILFRRRWCKYIIILKRILKGLWVLLLWIPLLPLVLV